MTPIFETLINHIYKIKNTLTIVDVINDVEFTMYDEDEDIYKVEGRKIYTYKKAIIYAYLMKIIKKNNIKKLSNRDKDFIIRTALTK